MIETEKIPLVLASRPIGGIGQKEGTSVLFVSER